MKRAKKGFTLIEVICVLVIIAIVAVIAVPSISKYIDNSKINNCKSTMNSFINDLEYKIVSRRYYDVDELNTELVKLVDSATDSQNASVNIQNNDDGTFKYLDETISDATGVCPNGGHYTVKWNITPGGDDNPNSAKVKIDLCECDCMEEHVHLNSSYVFTAALISRADYARSTDSKEDTYREDVMKIVDYINSRLNDPSDINDPARIDDIIKDYEELHKDDTKKYEIRGVTVKENPSGSGNTNWVEWISVSLHTDYSAEGNNSHDFITYYPEKKDGSNAQGAANDLQSGSTEGKLIIDTIETENGSEPGREVWPPVEGTSGSYFYLKDLDYGNNKSYQIADVDNAFQWLQRDGNWYIEKKNNTSTAGIDSGVLVAENGQNDYCLNSIFKLDTGKSLDIYMDPDVTNADFRDIFRIDAKYTDGSKQSFEHIKSSDLNKDDQYDYFIKNGYILVSSEDSLKDENGDYINWAGVMSSANENNTSDGESVDQTDNKNASQRETLKQVLREEDQIVNDIFRAVSANDYKNTDPDGKKYNEVTIAYQEYYKEIVSDGEDGYKYKYTPHTSFGTMQIYQETETSAVIKANGSDEAIGTISVKDEAGSYNINVKNTSSDGLFSTDDLEVTKKVTYTVKDMNDNVKCEETDTVILKAGVDYYIGTADDISSSDTNNTNATIDKINKGDFGSNNEYYIYIPGKGEEGKIGKISAGAADKDTLKLEYIKGEKDEAFKFENVNVWYECPILITDFSSGNTVEYGSVKSNFKHRTSSGQDGWYLTTNDSTGFLSTAEEKKLLDKINNYESSAVIKLYKKGEKSGKTEIDNVKIFDVKTEITSLSETHEAHIVEKSGWSSIFGIFGDFFRLTGEALNKVIDLFGGNFGVHIGGSDAALGVDVTANYQIKVTDTQNTEYSPIRFERSLNYDDYRVVNYVSLLGITHYKDTISMNDRRFMLYDKQVSSLSIAEENDFLENRLNSSFNGDIYIYYADNYKEQNSSPTKNTKFNVRVFKKFKFSFFDLPDFVYWVDPVMVNSSGVSLELKGYVFVEAYIGNDEEITIPATFKGKWHDKKPASGDYVEYVYNKNGQAEKIYYCPNDKPEIVQGWISGNSELFQVSRVGKGDSALYFADENVKNKLVSITVSEGIREIDNSAFAGLKLDTIKLPSTLTKIDRDAFNSVTLRGNSSNYEFVIPESVNEIYQGAFTNFKVNGTLRINGCAYDGLQINPDDGVNLRRFDKAILPRRFEHAEFKKLVFGSNVNTIEAEAFSGNTSAASLDLGSVKKIGANAFSNWNNATGSLVIPNTVTSIGTDAFVNYASKVNDVGDYPSLKVMGGTNNTTLDGSVFAGSHFNNITIGGNVSSVKESSFANYSGFKGSLRIENSVSSIGESAFEGCTGFSGSLILPRNQQFTKISAKAFMGCSGFTGDLDIPSSVTTIESKAFEGCSGFDGTLTLGSRLSTIKGSAFKDCSGFTGDLVIPRTVTTMGERTFDGFASSLDTEKPEEYPALTINGGSYGTTLGALIFTNSHFNNVTIGGNVKTIDALAFKNGGGKTDKNYNELRGNLKIENSVEIIGKAAFKDCTGFTGKLGISEYSELTSIGEAAFSGCKGFEGDIIIPSKVTIIGSRAFYDCVGFDGSLKLNDGLKKIGMEAFMYCTNLSGDLTIPETVTDGIGSCAFRNFGQKVVADSGRLGTLVINAGSYGDGRKLGAFIFTGSKFNGISIGGIVEEIGDNAFHHDNSDDVDITDQENLPNYIDPEDEESALTEYPIKSEGLKADYTGFTGLLSIGNSVKIIGTSAFENMGEISALEGMNNVISVGDYAFKECSKIASDVNFGGNSNLVSIGTKAFYNCCSIRDLSVPNSVGAIGESAFDYSGSGEGKLVVFGYRCIENNQRLLGYTERDNLKTLFNHAKYKDVTIAGNIDVIGYRFMKTEPSMKLENSDELMFDYSGIKGNLTIGGNVKVIDEEAFNLTGFDGTLSFADNNIVETIGHSAFENLYYIKGGVTIPESVTSIGTEAFERFGQNSSEPGPLVINGYSSISDDKEKLNTIDMNIFNYARFNNVTISGNVQRIADDFMNSYPDNFDYNGITGSLTIGPGVRSIGSAAFLCCEGFDGAVTLNTGLEKIGENAFNSCLNVHGDLTIPGTVSSIGTYAFRHFGQADGNDLNENKGSLTVLGYSSVKDGLKTIDAHIFDHAHFTNVTVGGTGDYVQYIADDFMENYNKESFDNGQTEVTRFNGVRGNLVVGDSVQKVGEKAFWDCKNFKGTLTIGSGVTWIGESAFSGLFGLYSDNSLDSEERVLIIPENVKYMGKFAFKGLSRGDTKELAEYSNNYPSLYIYGTSQNDGKTLGAKDDNDNHSIFANSCFRNVTIGGSVENIAEDFMNNSYHRESDGTRLRNASEDEQDMYQYSFVYGNLEIGSSVKSIGKNAFNSLECHNQDGRGKLILNEGLESIAEGAFAYCRFFGSVNVNERNLTIPKTVTSIGKDAFLYFSYNFQNPPSLTILGYTDGKSTAAEGVRKMIEPGIFDYSGFRNVTIGGSVYCVDGLAFNDFGKYQGWIGTLKFEPQSVGYENGSYHDTAMSYGPGWGPFRGCEFDKVVMPKELYQVLDAANRSDTKDGLFGNGGINVEFLNP